MPGRVLSRIGVTVMLLAVSIPSAATHHSAAMFDQQRELTLQGVIRRVDWTNPHVYIQVEGATAGGEDVVWAVEAGPPNVMSRNGWSSDSVKVGERVIVTVYPPKNSRATTVLGKSMIKEDGVVLNIEDSSQPAGLRAPDAPEEFVAEDLNGLWLTRWDASAALRFLQPSASWSLTDEGSEAVATYSGVVNPGKDCVSQTVPFVMVWPALHSIRIGQEVIVIRSEWGERTIHMNADSHDGASFSNQGHSIGRWDGDALVVDTTHFSDHRSGHGGGLPSGSRKHLIERFELGPGRDRIVYSYQVEDPEYLLEPITGSMELIYRPDLTLVTVPCDLEVARRYLEER